MPKYHMYLTKTSTEIAEIDVEAEDKDEAVEKAEEAGWNLRARHWTCAENEIKAEVV